MNSNPAMIYTEDSDDLSTQFDFFFHPPRRRRSSMFDRWIKEQQILPQSPPKTPTSSIQPPESLALDFNPTLPSSGTPPNAYLAYPDLARHPAPADVFDDATTVNSYDFVQDDDIPTHTGVDPSTSEAPTTPQTHKAPSFLLTPPSFRELLSFRSSSPHSISRTSNTNSPTPSRRSKFSRHHDTLPPHSQHSRAASLSTLGTPSQAPLTPPSSPGMSKWRPSVMGHFASPSSLVNPSSISDTTFTPSRPSMSSCITNTSTAPTTTSTIESEIQTSFHKLSLVDSIRSTRRSPSTLFKPGGTLSSLPLNRPATASGPDDLSRHQKTDSIPVRTLFALKSKDRYGSYRLPNDARVDVSLESADMTRPCVAYASANYRGTIGRMTFSRESKKKKLVARGVGPNESRKFEAFKRWCESFGEVHLITRMPDGDLHVHFRDAEVAETVCRLRARVYIAGVGSVFLSWYTGNKR